MSSIKSVSISDSTEYQEPHFQFHQFPRRLFPSSKSVIANPSFKISRCSKPAFLLTLVPPMFHSSQYNFIALVKAAELGLTDSLESIESWRRQHSSSGNKTLSRNCFLRADRRFYRMNHHRIDRYPKQWLLLGDLRI